MMKKIAVISALALTLCGCTAGFRPGLRDYQGTDAARIRVASDGNTALQFYEKQPDCLKKVQERRITAGLAILGIPVTGNKRIGIPAASYNNGYFINEFKVKPGQLITVIHYWTQQGYYQNSPQSVTTHFIPQAGHDYDIVVRGSQFGRDTVAVHDLDPQAKIVSWQGGKLCSTSIFD